jgi:hypothetical protein
VEMLIAMGFDAQAACEVRRHGMVWSPLHCWATLHQNNLSGRG